MESINFAGSTIRYLVLASDRPRESHEDATIRLLIQRERRRYEPEPEQKRIILTGRE